MPEHFADRLAALVEERRSRVVLGLDPDPAKLWPGSAPEADGDPAELTGAAVARHCAAVVDAAGAACVAVKPQIACFERLGAPGWKALKATIDAAHEHGLLVLADGKRGDVPVTDAAYAQGMVGATPGPYGPVEGLGADAFTANPLLGEDSLTPFVDAAAGARAGIFALVSTSNPGAADIQDLEAADGRPVHEHVAALVDRIGAEHVGESGLSLLGAVTGATRPERLARLRELMPRTIFLLPGVGAQGGDPALLGPAFEPHPAAGLVAASRSIVNAGADGGAEPARAAAAAAEELRATTWNL